MFLWYSPPAALYADVQKRLVPAGVTQQNAYSEKER